MKLKRSWQHLDKVFAVTYLALTVLAATVVVELAAIVQLAVLLAHKLADWGF